MCESKFGGFLPGPGEAIGSAIGAATAPAALGVGALLLLGVGMEVVTATVSAVDVFVTTFADTVWADFLVPGAWSIAVGAPVALLASLLLTWRHKVKTRPATPVPPVLAPVRDDDGHCWQCPVRAVPRGMLDAEIPATSTYVTDPELDLDLVEAVR
jgi:hypothetical protein